MPNTTPSAKKFVVVVKVSYEPGEKPTTLFDAMASVGFVPTRAVTRSGVSTQTDTQFIVRKNCDGKRMVREYAAAYAETLLNLYTQGLIDYGFVHSYVLGGKTANKRVVDVDFGRKCSGTTTDED